MSQADVVVGPHVPGGRWRASQCLQLARQERSFENLCSELLHTSNTSVSEIRCHVEADIGGLQPRSGVAIAWHAPIATWRQRHGSNFGTIGHAGSFELGGKESTHENS
jgi:hypothetical protein